MRRSVSRQSQPQDISSMLAAQRLKARRCQAPSECPCFSGTQKPIPLGLHTRSSTSANASMRMDECGDPDCMDLEQLKELQHSLDSFTDYEHYERCCDAHHPPHHHHHLVRHGGKIFEECCDEIGHERDCVENNCGTASDDCDDCEADCEECVDDHSDCFEQIDVREDDCEVCEEECEERGHDRDECPQNHPTTRDNCVASCDIPLPLLGPTNDFDLNPFMIPVRQTTPCTDDCKMPLLSEDTMDASLPPEIPFDMAMDHWQTFSRAHHCAPDPCFNSQLPPHLLPQHVNLSPSFSFGCDPMIVANQYPWQKQQVHCPGPVIPLDQSMALPLSLDLPRSSRPTSISVPEHASHPSLQSPTPATPSTSAPDRTCQWVMPCGSICGTNYARTEDLKKHVKNSHGTKGTVTCRWKGCSASFATEAALTGHISKKHLSFDEEGPWKCTFPSCSKSFMYKQVRDEHVASHTGGNRMHCPICHQWLNAEGSNFRRHMASHGPKHEHMKCKFEHLGCKRRFPRVDNLRRHEACCKFGKKAQGVHHHHHRIHNHTT